MPYAKPYHVLGSLLDDAFLKTSYLKERCTGKTPVPTQDKRKVLRCAQDDIHEKLLGA